MPAPLPDHSPPSAVPPQREREQLTPRQRTAYRIEVGESEWALGGLWRFFRSSPGIASYERVK